MSADVAGSAVADRCYRGTGARVAPADHGGELFLLANFSLAIGYGAHGRCFSTHRRYWGSRFPWLAFDRICHGNVDCEVDNPAANSDMNTEQVAQKVVELCRKQAWKEAVDTLYADEIVSVEARSMDGGSPETHGIEGVHKKVDWWTNSMEVHSFKVSGPFVAHDRFVVQFDVDVTDKNSKKRFQMSEVGVYTVKDGKIVREEFLPEVSKD